MTDVSSKPVTRMQSKVYASRRGRSPRDLKGMANAHLVMKRLKRGLPLRKALRPGASYAGFHSHCELFPKWAAEAKALIERNAVAGQLKQLENFGVNRKRAQTHCSRGHEFTTENTRLRTRSGHLNRECKRCERERQESRGAPLRPRAMLKAVKAMQRGVRFAGLRKIIDVSAFYRTIRQVPHFAAVHRVWLAKASKEETDQAASAFLEDFKRKPQRRRSPKDPRGLPNPEQVMEKLEAGLPLRIALRDTKRAGYQGFRSHCIIDPDWGARAKDLVEKNAEAGRILKLTNLGVFRKRALTHCPRGHEYTPENTRVQVGQHGGRSCWACLNLRSQKTGPLFTGEVREKTIEGMRRGLRLHSLMKICKDFNKFYRTVARDSEFGAVHKTWAAGGRDRLIRAMTKTKQQNRFNGLLALLPTYMTTDAKIEIINMIYDAHLARRYKGKQFGITKAKCQIKSFIADYYRNNPVNAYGDIKTPWSLDAQIGNDTNTRLIDTISEGLW